MSSPTVERLRAQAKARPRRVVLPEVEDSRTELARRLIEQDGLAEVVWVEDPTRDTRFDEVASHIFARRRHKGVDEAKATALASDPLYFAASLVGIGHADASVAGAAHATADVIRAGIHCVGTAPDSPLVSSFFLFVRDAETLSYADCGVVPDPDPDQLAAIAFATARNHEKLTGETARVAFLSFSTKGSADHPRVDKVRAALARFRAQHPRIAADGELQFDAAYVESVAERKAPDSEVAGSANVFIFPDLDAGNIAYKITERLGGFRAFGPLIQGLARPCLDLSRGCTPEDIVEVAVIASAMAE
ncbi:MAG: phosphotransacetylase [Planctomycetes bacterium]|nr:phosphotransacetylase [Planctomycetota bacterium]